MIRANGSAIAAGDLTVELTNIDPLSAPESMPGDFTSTGGTIESFGALTVQISDSAGESVNLGSGQTATVRIQVPGGATSPPATIPLFYFDESQGLWVEEGTATLVGTSPTWYYTGTVSHFSTWNADQYYDRVTIKGRVVDGADLPVAGATVTVSGQSYSATTSARTDSAGNFEVYAKATATVLVSAMKDGRSSNTRSLTTGASGTIEETLVIDPLVLTETVGFTVKLTWGATPSDLDSHLTGPITGTTSRFHVYYSSQGNLDTSPYAALDVDDTSSYGPEVVTISQLIPGTYRYTVHNYSESPDISTSSARVEATIDGVLYVYPLPEGTGLYWTVFEMTVADDGETVTVTPINTVTSSTTFSMSPSGAAGLARHTKGPLPAELLAKF